jgi:oligopeptide transport system substrate-binding protein
MRNKIFFVASLLIVASMVLGACATPTPETVEVVKTVVVTEVVEIEGETVIETQIVEKVVEVPAEPEEEEMEEPVTLYWNWSTEPPSADPSLATDTTSVDLIRNIFVGLTQFDPVTGEVLPYLATEWDVSEDGLTWTFKLRDDIAWVNYDPTTGETTQSVDADGNPRFVNANDVVYGVKRTVDPNTASDYAYVLYIIKNAQAINNGDEGVTLDDLGIVAVDDTTVEFTLESPAAYFPSIAGMWVANAMPQWAIEEWGDKWTEAGLIVTNGPMVMESWIHGGELNLAKNPLWINADDVQIERVVGVMVTEDSTAFAMYENNELDDQAAPLPEMDRIQADPVLSEELTIAPDLCTYYYGFTNNKPPFDDVRVRTAFAQSIDRQTLVDNVTKGGQVPATSFAPPGIFGAVEPGKVGLNYDPEAAKAALQEYLDENGMTIDDFNAMGVTLMHNTSEGHARIAAAIQQMWADNLGVDVKVENQEWKVYLDTIQNDTPLSDMPHVWRLGWCADYADQNNWVHEVFNADAGANRLRRGCQDDTCTQVELSTFDELTVQGALESDPAKRIEIYEEAERLLAGEEVAYAPIYHYTIVRMTKPWLTRNYPPLGGNDFFNWTIDQAAQMAGQ